MMETTPEIALALLAQMKRIRMVEEAIADRYPEGKMRCPTHLSIGQEAPAAVLGSLLRMDDLVVSSHRAHAHYLAKGGSLRALIAELYGKETGCSRGRGGSMHLVDIDAGFMGSTAIVANSIPVGAGLGLALRMRHSENIACIFLGDGAVEEGVFYETANFAVLRRLPVVFICENNGYSVYSPLSVRQPENRELSSLAAAIGLRSGCVDSVDVLALHAQVAERMGAAREECLPAFIEIKTFRWREHCGPNHDDDLGYRDARLVDYWHAHDPLRLLQERLLDERCITSVGLATMERGIRDEIEDAFRFAEDSPFPDPDTLAEGVYRADDSVGIPWVGN
jgi:pyruvate dehydrogenase E1 component alpha subunit